MSLNTHKMIGLKKWVAFSVAAFVCLVSPLTVLAEKSEFGEGTPHFVVQNTAERLVAALTADPAKLKADPSGYEKIVNEVLVPAIDFKTIAKRVMGKTHYLAASPEQRDRFREAFTDSLVSTYSTGLAIFDSQEIKVLPPKSDKNKGKSVQSVDMEVKTSDGTIFPLRFQVKQGKEDRTWKVVNVVLNGVNVGKAYNSHFSESMNKHGGNLDSVIANWNANITPDATPVAK